MKTIIHTPRHTCNTAQSGSERSENTCAACHEETRKARAKYPAPDYTAVWLKQMGR